MMPVMDWFGFAGHVLSSRWLITLIMTVLFVFPLALFRNFDHLRVTRHVDCSLVISLLTRCVVQSRLQEYSSSP
jgi:amino acid permease